MSLWGVHQQKALLGLIIVAFSFLWLWAERAQFDVYLPAGVSGTARVIAVRDVFQKHGKTPTQHVIFVQKSDRSIGRIVCPSEVKATWVPGDELVIQSQLFGRVVSLSACTRARMRAAHKPALLLGTMLLSFIFGVGLLRSASMHH